MAGKLPIHRKTQKELVLLSRDTSVDKKMASNLKTPPILEDEEHYREWKQDLSVWQLFTELEEVRQGPAVYLILKGNAREAVRDLKPEEIGAAGGVKKITDKLDQLFLKDINTQTYLAFKTFIITDGPQV